MLLDFYREDFDFLAVALKAPFLIAFKLADTV
jgi:hypothetical protein